MSSTYSSNLRIELIGSGDQPGAWGTTTDSNLAYILDTAIAGYQTVSVTSSNQALTYINGPTSSASLNQSVYAMLRFTTTNGAAFNVYAPPASKQYIIFNDSGYSMTIYNSTVIGNTTAAGSGVTIPDGKKVVVFSNSANFYAVDSVTSFSGGSTGLTPATATTGSVTLAGTLAVANGGTGVTTSTGSGSVVLSSSPTLSAPALGTPVSGNFSSGTFTWPTFNQNTSGNAATATKLSTASFSIEESGGKLVFKYGATTVGSLDSSGNLIVIGNVTAYGTP